MFINSSGPSLYRNIAIALRRLKQPNTWKIQRKSVKLDFKLNEISSISLMGPCFIVCRNCMSYGIALASALLQSDHQLPIVSAYSYPFIDRSQSLFSMAQGLYNFPLTVSTVDPPIHLL